MATIIQGKTTNKINKISSSKTSIIPILFPDDIATAPLVTLSLQNLLSKDVSEQAKLYDASKSLGFFYLDLRGCTEGEKLLKSANSLFDLGSAFFDLSITEKQRFDFAKDAKYYGYKAIGAEVIDGAGTRDRIEIYNIPKDDILRLTLRVPAPDLITQKRELLESYIHQNDTVLQCLFDSLTSCMSLPTSSSLASRHRISQPSGCHVRFIRAPPQPPDDRTTALGEHTDFGSLTILFNRIGGLQVLLPGTTVWVYVRPVPGCAIVNLGDAMVKFSAGLLRSNVHRVVSPPGAQSDLVRHSLVYFCRPENDVKLGRLKGGDIDEVEGVEDDVEEETAQEWLYRRHMGRKIQFFKGEETWDRGKGTDRGRI